MICPPWEHSYSILSVLITFIFVGWKNPNDRILLLCASYLLFRPLAWIGSYIKQSLSLCLQEKNISDEKNTHCRKVDMKRNNFCIKEYWEILENKATCPFHREPCNGYAVIRTHAWSQGPPPCLWPVGGFSRVSGFWRHSLKTTFSLFKISQQSLLCSRKN